MLTATVKTILTDEFGAEKDGNTLNVPEGARVSLLVLIGEELMPIAKVRTVTFGDNYTTVAAEDERYFVEPDSVFAVKEEDYAAKGSDNRPGFHS